LRYTGATPALTKAKAVDAQVSGAETIETPKTPTRPVAAALTSDPMSVEWTASGPTDDPDEMAAAA
jgi:hypothetical protein